MSAARQKTPAADDSEEGGTSDIKCYDANQQDTTICTVFDNVVPPSLYPRLLADYMRVVTSEYNLVENEEKDNSLTSGSYWFPLASACHNTIEEFIHYLSNAPAVRKVIDMDSVSGAEWWYQEQDHLDQPKELHTDCDIEVLANGSCTTSNPLVSSVFYISGVGGPTAVFDQVKKDDGGLHPMFPSQAVISFPHPNRILFFTGNLYHMVCMNEAIS